MKTRRILLDIDELDILKCLFEYAKHYHAAIEKACDYALDEDAIYRIENKLYADTDKLKQARGVPCRFMPIPERLHQMRKYPYLTFKGG